MCLQAGWLILSCRPTQEAVLAETNAVKKQGEELGGRWMDWEGENQDKEESPGSGRSMYSYILTYSRI